MRVFLSFLQSARRYSVPAYGFWERYVKRGLAEAGHEWVEAPGVDWAESLQWRSGEALRAWHELTWPLVVDFVKREHARRPISLFLGYLFPWQVEPGAIAAIRGLGVPCVNFFCDNVRSFRRIPASYGAFDLHWVPEKPALALYEAAGLSTLYAPMPCWVEPARRSAAALERYGPTFVGSRDRQRESLLAEALRRGADIEIRGVGWQEGLQSPPPASNPVRRAANQLVVVRQDGWRGLLHKLEERATPRLPQALFADHLRPAPAPGEYDDILQRARVCIGVSRYPSYRHPFSRPDRYSRLRDIEAPMLGACYLTEWADGIDDLYDAGREIEVYHDAEELVDKLAALIGDAPRRRRLREAGQRRALAEHTIPRTIERVARALGIGP